MSPARVLVVDDTPANVKLLIDVLTAKGYELSSATNGADALAKIAAAPPDLVLLDIMMPGLSGYDVCRRLRANAATALLPVVLCTSLDATQERINGIEAGADDFLTKPVNRAELQAPSGWPTRRPCTAKGRSASSRSRHTSIHARRRPWPTPTARCTTGRTAAWTATTRRPCHSRSRTSPRTGSISPRAGR